MIPISVTWILSALKIEADPELVELGTLFLMRLQDAPDKKAFVKNAIRKAMIEGPPGKLR